MPPQNPVTTVTQLQPARSRCILTSSGSSTKFRLRLNNTARKVCKQFAVFFSRKFSVRNLQRFPNEHRYLVGYLSCFSLSYWVTSCSLSSFNSSTSTCRKYQYQFADNSPLLATLLSGSFAHIVPSYKNCGYRTYLTRDL